MTDRKSHIIQTACELFLAKGYASTTMQDIMKLLDIAKGTIYHYFESKEAILEAVLDEMVGAMMEKMQKAHGQGNALEKMRALIEASNVAGEELIQQLHRPGNEMLHTRLLAKVVLKQAPIYAELIQQGCKEGIFNTVAPLEYAEWLLAGIQFLVDVGIYPWDPKDLERRIEAFPKLIEQQLQAPSGSFDFLIALFH